MEARDGSAINLCNNQRATRRHEPMMSDAADVPPACATSDPLLRCLRAKHIIYIGDSTVRFEYLALVSRIHRA